MYGTMYQQTNRASRKLLLHIALVPSTCSSSTSQSSPSQTTFSPSMPKESHPDLIIQGPKPGPWQEASSSLCNAGSFWMALESDQKGRVWFWLDRESFLSEGRWQSFKTLIACHSEPCKYYRCQNVNGPHNVEALSGSMQLIATKGYKHCGVPLTWASKVKVSMCNSMRRFLSCPCLQYLLSIIKEESEAKFISYSLLNPDSGLMPLMHRKSFPSKP